MPFVHPIMSFFLCVYSKANGERITRVIFTVEIFIKIFPSLNSLWLSFNWTNFYEKSQRVFFIIFYFSWEKCRRPIVNNNKNKLHHFWTAVTKIISRFERNYNAIKRYCGRLRGWTISPSFSVFSVVVDPTVK